VDAAQAVPATPRPLISPAAWAIVVGQVALVFGGFVAANLKHLFGGAAVVRTSGSETYASYLHSGFGLLLFATLLSLGLVVGGHRLLRARGCGADGRVPGGAALATVETVLLLLTGVTLASCWQRLCVYEDAYGASRLRLGVAFVELSVLGVLALTLAKVVFRRWAGYAGAVMALGAIVAVLASHFNADAYIARTNLDRAAAGKHLDVAYLATLSRDARSALDHGFVRSDQALDERLRTRYCERPSRDWREFRGIGACR
jgi:hypothetical protein